MKSLILIFALTFLILQASLSESYQLTQLGKVGLNEVSLLRCIEAKMEASWVFNAGDTLSSVAISSDGNTYVLEALK